MPNFVSIGLFCRLCWRKTQIFAGFWTSAFSGVANWQQSEKVEHVCTTTNLPLSNGVKIVSLPQRLHGEIGRTISDVQKPDELEMWANAQSDGRPAKYRWRPLFNAAVRLTPLLECRAVTLPRRETR